VESERHIDLFADLNLGRSDDEAGSNDDEDIMQEGISRLAPLLPRSEPDHASVRRHEPPAESSTAGTPQMPAPSKRKGRGKKAGKASNKEPSRWADKCMYAELLEMQETDLWPGREDGLPSDLETGWVALAPVPVGKRCLAISHQGGGTIGAGASIGVVRSHDTTE
jgi:snurportin-1